MLAEKGETKVTLFSVVNGRSYDPAALLENAFDTRNVKRENITAKSVVNHDVKEAILKEAENHDLVVIGASRKSALSHVFQGSLPEEIAEHCHKPLVMVNATRGLRSWVRRWL
jgi:nucleotide-binding universal stress UspA family protein